MDNDAYCHESKTRVAYPDWMASVSGSKRINRMSLPGTHDTMAKPPHGGDAAICQSMTLSEQLLAGIRALDIRLRACGNGFAIHHGPVYLHANFDDVLRYTNAFLDAHPKEFVLIKLKKEKEACGDDSDARFKRNFQTAMRNHGGRVFKPAYYGKFPTLDQVRGKIVILTHGSARYDGVYSISYGTNAYGPVVLKMRQGKARCGKARWELRTNWDLYGHYLDTQDDFKKVSEVFGSNNTDDYWTSNIGGSTGSFPYFVASGHSSPGTHAPRLSTGLVDGISAGASKWPDFPRVACFMSWCTIAFEGVNELSAKKIRSGAYPNGIGLTFWDFPGAGLIKLIIDLN